MDQDEKDPKVSWKHGHELGSSGIKQQLESFAEQLKKSIDLEKKKLAELYAVRNTYK